MHGRLRDMASGLRAHCRCGPRKVVRSRFSRLRTLSHAVRRARPHADDSIIALLWICVADPLRATLLPRRPLGQSVSQTTLTLNMPTDSVSMLRYGERQQPTDEFELTYLFKDLLRLTREHNNRSWRLKLLQITQWLQLYSV